MARHPYGGLRGRLLALSALGELPGPGADVLQHGDLGDGVQQDVRLHQQLQLRRPGAEGDEPRRAVRAGAQGPVTGAIRAGSSGGPPAGSRLGPAAAGRVWA